MPLSASSAAASIRAGWSLGNTLDAVKRSAAPGEIVPPMESETAWFNPPCTRELIRAVGQAGFDCVRLPVTWAQHMAPSGEVDPAWMDRVAEVTGWVLDEGLFCVLNVHHDAGARGWLHASRAHWDAVSGRFASLWRQIADRFADRCGRLIFEGFNEMLDAEARWTQPVDPEDHAWLNRFNQLFVDTVRASGGNNPERILSVQTYSGASVPSTLAGFVLPRDTVPDRLLLQVHNYDPEGFCWRRAEGRVLRDTWGTEEDLREIDALMTRLAAFSAEHGCPVMIGEFGTEDKGNPDARLRHAAAFTRAAREKGIPCFWWDCGFFALFDRHTGAVTQPALVRALMPG